jgi:hypothetical protein
MAHDLEVRLATVKFAIYCMEQVEHFISSSGATRLPEYTGISQSLSPIRAILYERLASAYQTFFMYGVLRPQGEIGEKARQEALESMATGNYRLARSFSKFGNMLSHPWDLEEDEVRAIVNEARSKTTTRYCTICGAEFSRSELNDFCQCEACTIKLKELPE